MAKGNEKKGVITISIIAAFIFTGVILFLSLSGFFGKDDNKKSVSRSGTMNVNSDALPGENNKEIKAEISPEEIHGKYYEEHDGWYYEFKYDPTEGFHGTYVGAYDINNELVANNPAKDYSEQGLWILENGEIKLFINNQYVKSLWSCGEYIIDSRNYFVGTVPENKDEFQSSFICKAAESGDTQILNFYSDGKMIMEIIRDDGTADVSADSASQPDMEKYSAFVGNYKVEDNKVIIRFIDTSEKVFYVVDDGIAGWVYRKNS